MKYRILKLGKNQSVYSNLEVQTSDIVVQGNTLFKNRSDFTEDEIRLITDDFLYMERLNFSDKETAKYIKEQNEKANSIKDHDGNDIINVSQETKNYKYILIK